jgi:hypothetical protein
MQPAPCPLAKDFGMEPGPGSFEAFPGKAFHVPSLREDKGNRGLAFNKEHPYEIYIVRTEYFYYSKSPPSPP